MKNRWLITSRVISLLLAMAVIVAPLQSIAAIGAAAPAEAIAPKIDGTYSGQVKLIGTARGVYSDTLTMPQTGAPTQPDFGSIDLALQLSQTVGAMAGYVDLTKTLVFSTEHVLVGTTPVAIGPYVHGSVNGTTFIVESEPLSMTVSGRTIKRQFRLTGNIAQNDVNRLQGEYRETVWGYARQPITVVGNFTLNRPANNAFLNPTPARTPHQLYLPLTQR